MAQFEVGKEYKTRSIGDYDCIFTILITGRTAKTVSYFFLLTPPPVWWWR